LVGTIIEQGSELWEVMSMCAIHLPTPPEYASRYPDGSLLGTYVPDCDAWLSVCIGAIKDRNHNRKTHRDLKAQ
jgi:hypothetical protein